MDIKEAKIILYCNNLAELSFAGVLHLLNDDNDNDLNILKEEALEIVLSELEKKEAIINEIEDLCIRKSDDEGEEYGGIIIWNFAHKIMDIIKKVGDK